jgi:hypothetical protein
MPDPLFHFLRFVDEARAEGRRCRLTARTDDGAEFGVTLPSCWRPPPPATRAVPSPEPPPDDTEAALLAAARRIDGGTRKQICEAAGLPYTPYLKRVFRRLKADGRLREEPGRPPGGAERLRAS